jgi:hypothetical protein
MKLTVSFKEQFKKIDDDQENGGTNMQNNLLLL